MAKAENGGRRSGSHRVAVIPGDGIGLETTAAALRVLAAAAACWGFELELESLPWGCEHYTRTGRMMEPHGLTRLAGFEAIFLGAVGSPEVPDRVSVWELIMPIRRSFEQYVNLRPIRFFEGVRTPVLPELAADVDLVVVRENTEGEYTDVGGRLDAGTPRESAVQLSSFSRRGVERVARYGFELASRRRGEVMSATKSNGLPLTMPFWDEVVAAVAADFPAVSARRMHVDALAALLVTAPASLDVIIASNLFGDILSDLGAAVVGGIGMGASANLNPERRFPSMFEPIHGSAPDIAGRGIANPVGQIWSGALMLRHLGHHEAAAAVMAAVAAALAGGASTPDLGGTGTTDEVVDAVIAALAVGADPATSAGAEEIVGEGR